MDTKYTVKVTYTDDHQKTWFFDDLTSAEKKYHNLLRFDEDVKELLILWGDSIIEQAYL